MLERDDTPVRSIGWSVTQWSLGIIGGIATFLGFFVAFGPADEYIGLGGDWSWRIRDVADAWMYTLAIGGLVLLAATITMAVVGRRRTRVPSSPLADLLLHLGIFTAVNAFVWAQDAALGGGIDYAWWVTVPWALALAGHAYAFATSARSDEPAETREFQHH
jgi:hypothetical protein